MTTETADNVVPRTGMLATVRHRRGVVAAVEPYDYLRQPDVLEQFLAACRTPDGSPHLPWDLLIVDECHNLMPSPFGEDSELCRMLRLVVQAQLRDRVPHDERLTPLPPRPRWEAKGYRPDEYSRWLLGDWRPIDELWEEVGVDPSRPEPAEIELAEWLSDTTAGPQRGMPRHSSCMATG